MYISTKFTISFISLALISWRVNASHFNWLNQLVSYIETENRFHSVVIFVEETMGSHTSKIEEIIRRISAVKLSICVGFTKTSKDNRPKMQMRGIATATLFIVIHDSNDLVSLENSVQQTIEIPYLQELSVPLDFLFQLTKFKLRPKCLFIFLSNIALSHEQFLNYMWSKDFLDTTILEIIYKTSGIFSLPSESANLHFFNPFSKIYSRGEYTSKTILFPNKLKDLQGYRIDVGLVDDPPMSIVKRNSSGHPVEITGPDVSLMKFFEQVMNFTAIPLPMFTEDFGVIAYNSKNNSFKASGLMKDLVQKKIKFLVNTVETHLPFDMMTVEWSEYIEMVSVCPVIPIIPPKENRDYTNFYKTFLIVTFLIFVIWIPTRLLKFEPRTWCLENIYQILLGNGVIQDPQRTAERIFYLCIIFIAFFYSSTIFANFTDSSLNKQTEMKIKNFEDLEKSGLVPILTQSTLSLTFRSRYGVDESLFKLGKRTIVHPEADSLCIEQLKKYKNVTCVIPVLRRKLMLGNNQDEDGHRFGKIMKTCFYGSPLGLLLEPWTPYVNRFNQILLRVKEAGLRQKWENHSLYKLTKINENNFDKRREKYSNIELIHLQLIIGFGYTISLCAFLGEIIISCLELRLLNKIKGVFKKKKPNPI